MALALPKKSRKVPTMMKAAKLGWAGPGVGQEQDQARSKAGAGQEQSKSRAGAGQDRNRVKQSRVGTGEELGMRQIGA